jgi:hypothetical protein
MGAKGKPKTGGRKPGAKLYTGQITARACGANTVDQEDATAIARNLHNLLDAAHLEHT